jgi:AbrB family looped-hinge helix DNA binding protein
MATATITSKHQITIPKSVRQKLNLREGDRVEFDASDATKVVLVKCSRPNKSDGAAKQFIKPHQKALSIEEMKAAVKDAVGKKYPTLNK